MTHNGLSLPPRLGGRYRILRRLGSGSIAQVVSALDEQTGAQVALKVLYPNLQHDPAVVDRFRREVQVVRRIDHPHVIRIHDLADSQGLIYLVMDLHPGGDLAERLARQGPLGQVDVLCRQLCAALEAAHRAGVIHRDVKPQNVLTGEGPLDARLCDFGLARTADLAGLTTRSTVLGTPAYMAPEVIADGHADPRSDLYSLGVVLFEAATGRLPFQADSPFQLLRQHLTAAAPRARSLAPQLSPALDEVIARALAKDPLDRFASADEMAAALDGARPPALTSTHRGVCRRCQGQVVASVCVDCGQSGLRLERDPQGVAVLVTGPGQPAEKLDGKSYVALVKLLDELPPDSAQFAGLRRRPPRLPFYCAAALTPESAQALVLRLEGLGLTARITRRAGFGPRELHSRMARMVGRTLMITGSTLVGFGWLLRAPILFAPEWIVPALLAMGTLPFVMPVATALRPALHLGSEGAPAGLLAAALGRLHRREDRRLVARILERLEALGSLGGPALAQPLMVRAAQVAEALIASDTQAAAQSALELQRAATRGDDVGPALDELRESERMRAVLVADLLRTHARLDGVCLKLARVAGLEAAARARALGDEVRALEVELAAEVDVARLLEGGT